MRKRVLAGLAALLLWAGGAAASDLCPLPPGAEPHASALPRTRQALAGGKPLTVVALGSSSTEGVGASGPAATYPSRLQAVLAGRHAASGIVVLNKGIGGETAEANLRRLDRDVLGERPDLVIWQVGTNDSIRGVPLADFAETVRRGAVLVHGSGADLILMNPQSYPGEAKVPSYPAFAAAVLDLGRDLGVPVLDRYGIMKWWLDSGRLPADRILSPDGLHLKDTSYACLAEFLADMIDGTAAAGAKTATNAATVR